MALSRQLMRAPALFSQCQRLATVNYQKVNDYGTMAFTFATPASVYYKEAEVKQIDVPTMSGRFGILVDHVPTVGALTPGVVRVINNDSTTNDYFVSTGTVTVNDDSSVQILAEEAYPLDSFDANAIRTNLQDAQKVLASTSSEAEKAEAQIAVECLETLSKAVS